MNPKYTPRDMESTSGDTRAACFRRYYGNIRRSAGNVPVARGIARTELGLVRGWKYCGKTMEVPCTPRPSVVFPVDGNQCRKRCRLRTWGNLPQFVRNIGLVCSPRTTNGASRRQSAAHWRLRYVSRHTATSPNPDAHCERFLTLSLPVHGATFRHGVGTVHTLHDS
jgi:hypothetical protein